MQQQQQKRRNVINPSENARKVDIMALRAETVFIWVAIAITSIGFFLLGQDTAIKLGAPKWLAFTVGVVAGALSGYVTDYSFRHLLEEVVFQPLAWLHPGSPKAERELFFQIMGGIRWLILATIVTALFVGDWYSVQAVRDPFANQAQEKPTTDVTTFSAALQNQLSAGAAPMAEQIKTLKRDIADAEKRVEAGNPGLVSLQKEGNSWAAKELAGKKARATKEMKKDLDVLQKEYNTAISDNTRLLNTETKRIQESNLQINNQNATQRTSLSDLYFYSGAGAKALSVLLRIFLVISFLVKNPTLDANGDGVVDGKDVTAGAGGRPVFQ